MVHAMGDDETESSDEGFATWGVVEIMGHRSLAGKISEQELFGSKFLRVDIPVEDAGDGPPMVTQFYGGAAVFSLLPTSEEVARRSARTMRPDQVHVYGLPRPRVVVDDDDEYDDD